MPHADQKKGGLEVPDPPPPENSNLSNSHSKFTENSPWTLPPSQKTQLSLGNSPPPPKIKNKKNS